MASKWIQDYLTEAITKQLCTKINCTTCGAKEFRVGLLHALASATGRSLPLTYNREICAEIASELAAIDPKGIPSTPLEAATRCILYDIWTGIPALDREIAVLLAGSWAGDVLSKMIAHYESLQAAKRAKAEFESPEVVAKRKDERKRIKQEQHAHRLELKKIRDQIWHAQHKNLL